MMMRNESHDDDVGWMSHKRFGMDESEAAIMIYISVSDASKVI